MTRLLRHSAASRRVCAIPAEDRESVHQLARFLGNRVVALAGDFLQSFDVAQRNLAVAVLDETLPLESANSHRHAWPAHREHLRQKLVSETEVRSADRIRAQK